MLMTKIRTGLLYAFINASQVGIDIPEQLLHLFLTENTNPCQPPYESITKGYKEYDCTLDGIL